MSADDGEKKLRPGQENVLIRAGKGRPPRAKNHIPAGMKEELRRAFELTGGTRRLYKWAIEKRRVKIKHADGSHEWEVTQPNLEAFYSMLVKLIPTEMRLIAGGEIIHRHYIANPQPVAPPPDMNNNNENTSDDKRTI